MGTALKYLQSIGLNEIHNYEKELTEYLFDNLEQIDDLKILGPSPLIQPDRGPLATFLISQHANMLSLIL